MVVRRQRVKKYVDNLELLHVSEARVYRFIASHHLESCQVAVVLDTNVLYVNLVALQQTHTHADARCTVNGYMLS